MSKQIVFFGSSEFSLPVLEKILNAQGLSLCAIITTPDKPAGRHLKLTPNPVKVLAQKNNILILEPNHYHLEPDVVGLVAAYGKIIPQEILDKFNGQIYNIHPSLLPKYRGPSPLQQQILDGITETGVTIIQLDALMDHGPVVAITHDIISPDDTTETLGNRLFEKGADLFIDQYSVLSTQKKEQDHSQATYTKKLTRQDGFLPWEEFNKLITNSTQNRHAPRLFRAFFPWPGVWSIDPHGQRRKLVSLSPLLIR